MGRLNKALKLVNAGNMDAKKILKRMEKHGKESMTITIDPNLRDEIYKRIGEGKFSRLIETLLRDFLESLDKEKK